MKFDTVLLLLMTYVIAPTASAKYLRPELSIGWYTCCHDCDQELS